MLKFLKEIYKNWNNVQNEMAEMGIWNMPSTHGSWTYVDRKRLEDYINKKQKEKQNEST